MVLQQDDVAMPTVKPFVRSISMVQLFSGEKNSEQHKYTIKLQVWKYVCLASLLIWFYILHKITDQLNDQLLTSQQPYQHASQQECRPLEMYHSIQPPLSIIHKTILLPVGTIPSMILVLNSNVTGTLPLIAIPLGLQCTMIQQNLHVVCIF